MNDEIEKLSCGNCGHADRGRFCSNCGAPLGSDPDGIIQDVASETLQLNDRYGYIRLTLWLFRNPFRRSIELHGDRLFRHHTRYLLSGLGLYTLLAVPAFLYTARGLSQEFDRAGVEFVISAILYIEIYIYLIFCLFLGNAVFRAASSVHKSISEYYRLLAIGWGWWAPSLGVIVYAGYLVSSFGLRHPVATGFSAIVIIWMSMAYAYFILIHRTFWSISWSAAILFSILVGILAKALSYLVGLGLSLSARHIALRF